MRLYIGAQMVLPVLESLTLRKSRSEAAATLTAAMALAAADTYLQKPAIALGDVVRLLDDEGEEAFLGSIHHLERTPEKVTLTAYDRGIFLARNELCGFYAGSPAEIVGQVAAELEIPTGTVEAPAGWLSIAAHAGQSAFSLLRRAVGEGREIAIRDGALWVSKSAWMVYPLQPSQIVSCTGAAGLGEMVNRCLVTGRNGAICAAAENEEEIGRYGRFQSVLSKSGDDPAAQARAALTGRVLSGEVSVVPGHLNYRCGAAVELHRPEWGLDGVYAVTASAHRWEGGIFTTDMELEFVKERS